MAEEKKEEKKADALTGNQIPKIDFLGKATEGALVVDDKGTASILTLRDPVEPLNATKNIKILASPGGERTANISAVILAQANLAGAKTLDVVIKPDGISLKPGSKYGVIVFSGPTVIYSLPGDLDLLKAVAIAPPSVAKA